MDDDCYTFLQYLVYCQCDSGRGAYNLYQLIYQEKSQKVCAAALAKLFS